MADIIISAHGGRWKDQQATLQLPEGTTVIYYVKDGGILPNSDGYKILANLQKGTVPGGTVAQTVYPGGKTYDYACWFAPEFKNHCGIFEVGSTKLVKSLNGYSGKSPLWLSQIIAMYPNRTIYWLCCREVSVRTVGAELHNSPGSFLTSAPPQSGSEPQEGKRGRRPGTAKKSTAKKGAAKKATVKKATAKKATAKKTTAKKTTVKKATAKKGATKKTAAKKTTARKGAASRSGVSRRGSTRR